MEIRLASLLQGAQEAAGTTIIIDVFRAFTTAAVAFDRARRRSCWWRKWMKLWPCAVAVLVLCMGESMGNARRILILAIPRMKSVRPI